MINNKKDDKNNECGAVVWRECVSVMREGMGKPSDDLPNQEINQW